MDLDLCAAACVAPLPQIRLDVLAGKAQTLGDPGSAVSLGQAEALERGPKELPRSEEAQRLAEAWRRLLDEIARAQSEADESLREELLPRLQEELEALKKRFKELQPKRRGDKAPIEI